MTEPLSIASSVAGLIAITVQIAEKAGALRNFGKDVKDAPKSVRQIQEEIDEMNMIFRQVRLLLKGTTQTNPSRWNMISLNQLSTTLSGCVLLCSNLNTKLDEVSGLRGTGKQKKIELIKERIKWALWTEDEAGEIIEDLQPHKLSLSLMLTIIQCNNSSDASASLLQLHQVVAKILDSNHAISTQLREVINRCDQLYLRGVQTTDVMDDSTSIYSEISSSTYVTAPSGGSLLSLTHTRLSSSSESHRRASLRSNTSSSTSKSSVLKLQRFSNILWNSRAYKRLEVYARKHIRESSAGSFVSFNSTNSTIRGQTWSMLSAMSLGGMSLAEIAVFELPICFSDLSDSGVFQKEVLKAKNRVAKSPRRTRRALTLHTAIRLNRILTIRSLLDSGANLERMDSDGRTALAHAASLGYINICKQLLEKGAKPDVTDSTQRTLLSLAACNGSHGLCHLLLKNGALSNSTDSTGRTPLSYAAAEGHKAIVQLLLTQSDVDINTKDNAGRTPLSWAAGNGHEAVVRLLIAQGDVDISTRCSLGRTPLTWAMTNKHENVVMQLLLPPYDEVVYFIKEGLRLKALSFAIQGGNEDLVRHLLDTNINKQDPDGRTALTLAAMYGQDGIVRLLLANPAIDINAKDRGGRTPLAFAATYGHEAIVRLLLAQSQVDINTKDIGGRTPLESATMYANEAVVELFLARDVIG